MKTFEIWFKDDDTGTSYIWSEQHEFKNLEDLLNNEWLVEIIAVYELIREKIWEKGIIRM